MGKHKIILIREKKTATDTTTMPNECPKHLYKFISLDRGICKYETEELNNQKFFALKNNKIWLSHYSKMNDPFEYIGIKSNNIDYDSVAGEMCKGLEKMKGELFLSSLAENKEDASMWAYYANDYNGFCVEYEVKNNINNPKKIIYSDTPKDFNKNQYNSIIQKDESAVSNLLQLINRFIVKNRYWEHEKEYRIFDSEQNAEKRKSNNNGLLRDLSEFGLKTKAIYIGLKCSEMNKKVLIDIAKELKIKSFDMVKDENRISFRFQEINDEKTN